MEISDEDADELLSALLKNGFSLPFDVQNAPLVREEIILEANRNAIRKAVESTDIWNRYRIY